MTVLVVAVACSTDPDGVAEPGLCCECTCSTADGTECLSLTFDYSITAGEETDACPALCAVECAAQDSCSIAASATACLVEPAPPQTPGSGPEHPRCNPADEDYDSCRHD